MIAATVAIGGFMFLANSANAAYYGGPHPAATTLSHCGWLPVQNRAFETRPRTVRIVQSKLESLGYSVGDTGIDGIHGRRTKKAMKAFQARYQLPTHGGIDGTSVSHLAYLTHTAPNVARCQRTAITR